MTKLFILMIGLMMAASSWAQSGANVVLLKGTATFAGKKLSAKSQFKGSGVIEVGDKSYLKILLKDSNTTLVIGANTTTKINLALPAEKQELNLVKGIARWVTGNKKGLGIRTSNAVMGVRGTDFFTSYNPLLGETEIICFSGEIEMSNVLDESDKKAIKKNQWGGIGGRFGKKLSDVLTLTPDLISTFESALPK